MSTVVQSTCPGCKQPLRIPSDWLTQAIRCKHCGLVLQAKSSAAYVSRSSGIRPAASPRTPPVARPIQAVAAPAPLAAPAPPLAIALPTPGAYAPGSPAVAASPFDRLDADTSGPSRPSRYRRRSGGWWKGPAIALSVLVVAAVVTVFCWPYIRGVFDTPQQASVQPDKDRHDAPIAERTDHPSKDNSKDQKPVTSSGSKGPNDSKHPGPRSDDPAKPAPDPSTTEPKPIDNPRPPDNPRKMQYPRRASIISVHNYLYANPVHAGISGPSAHNLAHFSEALNKGLHIPLNEIAHLSDAAEKGQARAPMKPVIEKTLTDFLDSSRGQDCILVFFIGHAVVVGDDTYLVPIEGEMDYAETLIPLKWVYDKLAGCKARQKVLVLDVNRLNPAHGVERPNGGPMDPKEDAAFAAPPDGVEVWTACLAGQQSYEMDEAHEGAFIEQLYTALAPGRNEKGLEGVIQTPGQDDAGETVGRRGQYRLEGGTQSVQAGAAVAAGRLGAEGRRDVRPETRPRPPTPSRAWPPRRPAAT